MREGLAGLTLRGRAFLAAGVTAVVCSVLLGQSALTRIGVLVVALPLLAAVSVGRRRHALTVRRDVTPRMVTAGQPARVDLVLTSAGGRRGAGALLVEDQLPYSLGSRPRFTLQGLGRAWERTVGYPIRSDVRGQFTTGPLTTSAVDPFGLVEVRRRHAGTQTITVTPRTVALPAIGLTAGWSGAGEHRPQSFAAGSAEDASVREYRRGDELRRVHWRSSARIGELMVRKEEQPWEARATVLLDNRLTSHRGRDLASSFEAAVTIAASVALHLDEHGYTVRLVTADAAGPDQAEPLSVVLERLALVQLAQRPTIDLSWAGERSRGGLLIAVLGALSPQDGSVLRRLRHDAGNALALELDVAKWGTTRADQDSTTPPGAATAGGWRSVTVGPRDRLDQAWRDLGRGARHSARAAGAAR